MACKVAVDGCMCIVTVVSDLAGWCDETVCTSGGAETIDCICVSVGDTSECVGRDVDGDVLEWSVVIT